MNKIILLFLSILTVTAHASSKIVDADSFRSSDRTKTWALPAGTDTLSGIGTAETYTAKKVFGEIAIGQTADTSTGTVTALSTSGKSSIDLTGATTMTLQGIANGSTGKLLTLSNQTGNALTIANQSTGATSTNRIVTGTGADLTVASGAQVILQYDLTLSRWLAIGGSGGGTTGNLTDVGTDGITVTGGTGAVNGSGTSFAQAAATNSQNGYLTSADHTTFAAKSPAFTATAPIAYSANVVSCIVATGSVAGCISAADWTTFNAKAPAFTVTAPVTYTSNVIAMPAATTSVDGYLSHTDWNTFNGKGAGSVTAVSVATANGFSGSSSGGATPALTVIASGCNGVCKSNATALSTATSGTDYSAGTSGLATGILKSTTTTGALTIATAGTDYQAPWTVSSIATGSSANGATFSANVFQLQAAAINEPGIITAGAQGFSGEKNFGADLLLNEVSTPAGTPSSGQMQLYPKSDNNFYIKGPDAVEHQITGVGTINASDWAVYTPTLTGFGTVTNNAALWRQSGDSIEVMAFFTSGTVAASIASITLPNSYTLNTAKIPVANTTSADGQVVGGYSTNAKGQVGAIVTATGTSSSLLYFGGITDPASAAHPTIPQNGNGVSATGVANSLKFTVPISALTNTLVFGTGMAGTAWTVDNGILVPSAGFSMSSSQFRWRRVGDSMEILGDFTSTSASASQANMVLKTGYLLATDKLSTSVNATELCKMTRLANTNAQVYAASVGITAFYDGSTSNTLFVTDQLGDTAHQFTKENVSAFGSSGNVYGIHCMLPIAQGGSDWTATPYNGGLAAPTSEVDVYDSSGADATGSTNTKVRIFNAVRTNQGSDITYATSATLGDTFTINTTGVYSIEYLDVTTNSPVTDAITRNASGSMLTTAVNSLYGANPTNYISVFASNGTYAPAHAVKNLNAGDVIRAQVSAASTAGSNQAYFRIVRID